MTGPESGHWVIAAVIAVGARRRWRPMAVCNGREAESDNDDHFTCRIVVYNCNTSQNARSHHALVDPLSG